MDSQNKTTYLLAGESGGSKTVLCLLGTGGELLNRIETGGVAAIKAGMLPVKQYLSEGIGKIREATGIKTDQIIHCYFSLGGPNQQEVETALKECLPATRITVGREADGDMIMTCLPYFNCAAAVLAGTGTAAVGESNGKRRFAGGWGYELDDAGGGGKIGRDALNAFLRALDRREKPTSLSAAFSHLTDNINLETFSGRMELKRKIHLLSRKQIAALTPKVYACFLSGDAVAAEIITKAAGDIAALAAAVTPDGESRILCLGGIFKLGQEFRDMCSKALKKLCPGSELVFRDNFDLAKGACLMVLKMSGSQVNIGELGHDKI